MIQIIKCKNCEYFHEWDDGSSPTCMYWTDIWDVSTWADGFCSFGKLKAGCEAETYKAVRHGHWEQGYIPNDDGSYTPIDFNCSVCGQANDVESNYCPNCGAKMNCKI